MAYKVQQGDSPARIARRFGIPMSTLIHANPHKPTTIVAGQHTWRGLRAGEAVNVPVGVGGVGVGAYAPAPLNAPHAQIKQGSTGPDVALWQTIIGATPDGIFGPNTAAATKAWQSKHGLAADGIVGPKSWAAAGAGGAAPAASAPAVTPVYAPSAPSVPVTPAAAGGSHGTIRQGSRGPDVALWQTIIGTTPDGIFGPNTDKATRAWQSAHGLAADGIVGPNTWGAALGGAFPAPSAASPLPSLPSIPAAMPIPTFTPSPTFSPTPVSTIPNVTPASTAANVATAVAALARVDPCYSGNVMMVCAAQAALGIPPDGKYGPATAAAVQRLVPGAPPPCATPLWWGKKGDNKCTGSTAPSLPTPSFPLPSVPSPATPAGGTPIFIPTTATTDTTSPGLPTSSATATITPGGPAQPAVTAPAPEKKLSTGALVAGGLGIAALVGVTAVALSGKKGHHPSGSSRRGGHHPRKAAKKRKR